MQEKTVDSGVPKKRSVRRIVRAPRPDDLKREWAKRLRDLLLQHSREIADRLRGDMRDGFEMMLGISKFDAELLEAYYEREGWGVVAVGDGADAWGLRFGSVEFRIDDVDLERLGVDEPAKPVARRRSSKSS